MDSTLSKSTSYSLQDKFLNKQYTEYGIGFDHPRAIQHAIVQPYLFDSVRTTFATCYPVL
ncbi:uncharacterized protein METZ01_LOCUS254734 [marine metagenome]|uniref:Uncharacterized protein n=1 Tax=marine metagenome TaxID=408172 RepID=A0A382IQC8_9ZZZZ